MRVYLCEIQRLTHASGVYLQIYSVYDKETSSVSTHQSPLSSLARSRLYPAPVVPGHYITVARPHSRVEPIFGVEDPQMTISRG